MRTARIEQTENPPSEIDEFVIESYETESRNITITAGQAGSYYVIVADYEGMQMKNVEILPLIVDEAGSVTIPRKKDFVLSEGDKIMLWSDLTELNPLCDILTMQQ